MQRYFFALFLVLASSAAHASEQIIEGAGLIQCGQYTDGRHVDKALAVSWVQGFLSAVNLMNHARAAQKDRADTTGIPAPETIAAYLEKECTEQPLDLLFEVATRLRADLEKRQAP